MSDFQFTGLLTCRPPIQVASFALSRRRFGGRDGARQLHPSAIRSAFDRAVTRDRD